MTSSKQILLFIPVSIKKLSILKHFDDVQSLILQSSLTTDLNFEKLLSFLLSVLDATSPFVANSEYDQNYERSVKDMMKDMVNKMTQSPGLNHNIGFNI